MKNKNLLNKRIKILAYVSIFVFSFSVAKAQFVVSDIMAELGIGQQTVQGITQAYQTVKTVYQATKAAEAAAQNVQNLNMSQLASSLSGDAMTQVGDIVTQNLGTVKDPSTNVLTNGQQVITDLNGYINKSSTNAVKKSLNDFQGADTNPYQSSALADTIKKLRSAAQNSVDKLKIVGLAAIAQKEICNSSKLKDVIKNGEPSTWVNPKPALKNVNIDELCNANLTATDQGTDQTDQYGISSWTTPVNQYSKSSDVKNLKAFLFDKGYFITAPTSSIFDSATTDAVKAFQKDQSLDQGGEVDDMTQTAMISAERQSKAITGKAAQAAFISIANAGYGGPLTKAALADPTNSPSGIQASVQSEINKQVADSQFAATNKFNANGGIIGNEKCLDKNGNVKKFDPTDPTTAYCDNIVTDASSSAVKIKADLDAARQSPYLGILAKANSTNDCGGKDKTLTDICKGTKSVNSYVKLINSILGITSSVSSGGIASLKDTQYSQLASSLDGLKNIDQSKADLSKAATASTNNYNTAQEQASTVQTNGLNTPASNSTTYIQPTSLYSGKRFDYDNSSNDRVLLNNLMSVAQVRNMGTGNMQTLGIELNTSATQDWGIDPNLVDGTYKIIDKSTGKVDSSGDIGSTSIPSNSLVTNNGKKFKIFDAYILDNLKGDINANGGIKNTIIDITFNIYFRSLNTQKNPNDFSVDIRFYIDGSKY